MIMRCSLPVCVSTSSSCPVYVVRLPLPLLLPLLLLLLKLSKLLLLLLLAVLRTMATLLTNALITSSPLTLLEERARRSLNRTQLLAISCTFLNIYFGYVIPNCNHSSSHSGLTPISALTGNTPHLQKMFIVEYPFKIRCTAVQTSLNVLSSHTDTIKSQNSFFRIICIFVFNKNPIFITTLFCFCIHFSHINTLRKLRVWVRTRS